VYNIEVVRKNAYLRQVIIKIPGSRAPDNTLRKFVRTNPGNSCVIENPFPLNSSKAAQRIGALEQKLQGAP